MELNKENQYLRDELLRVTRGEGELARRHENPKGPITTEELEKLPPKAKDLKREEKLEALTKTQEDQAWINSIRKGGSSEN